jgi:hypothetical protein
MVPASAVDLAVGHIMSTPMPTSPGSGSKYGLASRDERHRATIAAILMVYFFQGLWPCRAVGQISRKGRPGCGLAKLTDASRTTDKIVVFIRRR